MFFDRFDAIYVINLAYRADRRKEVAAELEKLGVDGSRYQLFSAISPTDKGLFDSNGAHGAFLSHYNVLKIAAAAGTSVLVLEDDCNFSSEAKSFELPDDFDIFYGGYQACSPGELGKADIIGAHCMGFSARAAKKAAAYLDSYLQADFRGNPREPDGFVPPDKRPPVDGAYVWFREKHPHLRTVFARPPIAYQRPSRSDIAELPIFDRLLGLRQVSQYLRRFKAKRS